jgi:exonuclease SbcC
MRVLMPELTLGRYRDVRLSRDEESPQGPDLRIRMWDEAAGRYVGKSVLSGGAQDQSSLALRLAFALATRPKELGARPGFIFLDEPLSSFDGQRAQAFTRLLTVGMIGREFPQVFLISHRHAFNPSSFRYTVRLDGGVVAASNLPKPREAARMWESEAIPARAAAKR